MSDKLQIYACNGLEDGSKTSWVGEGTSAITNTQAENIMLSYMNMYATEYHNLQHLSDVEREELLNNLDLASVGFHYARLYKTDKDKLHTVGLALQALMDNGSLSISSDSMDVHAAHVDEIIEKVDSLVDADELVDVTGSTIEWWKEHVVGFAKVGIEQGVGAPVIKDYGDLNEFLYNGGTYFLYLFIPEDKLRELPWPFTSRRRKEAEVYKYCLESFTSIYGTKEDMDRVIRSGIIKDFGDTPENLAAAIVRGDNPQKEGVGGPITWTAMAIAYIVAACVAAVAAIIAAIIDYAKQVSIRKYTVPDNAEYGTPDPDDFEELKNNKGVDIKTFGLGAVAIAAVLFLLNSNDKK